MKELVILYENEEWIGPLQSALERADIRHRLQFVGEVSLDLTSPPDDQLVFFSRCSASSYLRGRPHSVTHYRLILQWLDIHGACVVNGINGMELEVSKVRQYLHLTKEGIDVPDYRAVIGGKKEVLEAASQLGFPLVIKPNCGGKGHGVKLFSKLQELEDWCKDLAEWKSNLVDGVLVVQKYIQPTLPRITRVEILNGHLLYAMYTSTAAGFELCPADSCLPNPSSQGKDTLQDRFTVRDDILETDPLVQKYISFMAKNQIAVAGFEFIEDFSGRRFTYDVNVSTNYSTKIQAELGRNCYDDLVGFLGSFL